MHQGNRIRSRRSGLGENRFMATNSYRVTCRTCAGTGYVRKWIFFKKICVQCFGIGYRTVDYDIKRYRPSPPPPMSGATPRRRRVEEVKTTAPTPEPFNPQGGSFGRASASDSWSESSNGSSSSSSSSDSSSSSSDDANS